MSRLIWHSVAPWAPSGYGTQTAIWIKELAKMGHEVIVSSYWGLSGAPTQWEGITILPGFGHSYCTGSLFEHYKAVKPELVITLGDVWVLDPNLLKQMPVAHWLPSDCRPMSHADRNVVEIAGDELIAMSHFGFDRFTSAGFRPQYVPHAIDLKTFYPGDRKKLREDAELGSEFVIGVNSANNDAIRKALPEIMLAFAKFLQDHPDSILTVHSGVHQDGGQDLEFLAGALGITDRVRAVDQYRYNSGLVTASDLKDWYTTIDVLCCTSFGEGFGLPIIEAQACGTPVITTNASSMEEVNPHGLGVDGEPFWNGVHRGWWMKPYISQIVDAFEKSWENRDNVDRDKLRAFAGEYEVSKVSETYMKPAVDELLRRVQGG